MRAAALLCLVLLWAESAAADPPAQSLRPNARGPVATELVTRVSAAPHPEILEKMSAQAVAYSPRPQPRSAQVQEKGRQQQELRRRGAVCGDLDIQGDAIGTVPGPGQCGIEGAVRVRSVAGVQLSQPALMDCNTATALKRWVETGARPVIGASGGGIASLRVAAHYACRGRNNVAGARLSEHAFGNAIDIAGIRLRDGTEISVLRGWGSQAQGTALRQMHRAACGTFGTVLGPEANAAHRDHFHFDTASYSNGAYCR